MIMPYVGTSGGTGDKSVGGPCSSQSWGKLTLMCAKVAIIESAFSTRPTEKQKSFARCLLILSKLFLYLI